MLLEALLPRAWKSSVMIERDRLIEILVSVTVVGVFVGLLIFIGSVYNDDGFGPEGGLALMGAIIAFIVVMTIVGIGLAYQLNKE